MLVIWNERANPVRARAGERSDVTASPGKRIAPASGRRSPESRLMKVVLPAPFGPITACGSPSSSSKSMLSLARSAPKDLHSPHACRSASAIARSGQHAGETAAEEDYGQNQQRPEDRLPVLGPAGEQALDHQQHRRAEQRTRAGRDTAEDHHEHDFARACPM